jgi:protein-S-isoprenylcysteine O-methyltransferase Ste14
MLAMVASPLLLGSPWALIPASLSAVLYVVRTYLEDKLLKAELPGYADYAHRTQYRLVPGIW